MKDQPDTSPPQQETGIQRLGHQIASGAGVLVVALVEFGVPLTPGQQSSILSIIVTGWAIASSIYAARHRVNNPTPPDAPPPRHRARRAPTTSKTPKSELPSQ